VFFLSLTPTPLHRLSLSFFSVRSQRELLLLYNISPSRYIQQESFTLLALRHAGICIFCVSHIHPRLSRSEREPLAGLGSLTRLRRLMRALGPDYIHIVPIQKTLDLFQSPSLSVLRWPLAHSHESHTCVTSLFFPTLGCAQSYAPCSATLPSWLHISPIWQGFALGGTANCQTSEFRIVQTLTARNLCRLPLKFSNWNAFIADGISLKPSVEVL
jgi:hypothetical protein